MEQHDYESRLGKIESHLVELNDFLKQNIHEQGENVQKLREWRASQYCTDYALKMHIEGAFRILGHIADGLAAFGREDGSTRAIQGIRGRNLFFAAKSSLIAAEFKELEKLSEEGETNGT
ncbi:MAG: hypothetical protein ABIP80_06110 [Ferruginibacter sp.]